MSADSAPCAVCYWSLAIPRIGFQLVERFLERMSVTRLIALKFDKASRGLTLAGCGRLLRERWIQRFDFVGFSCDGVAEIVRRFTDQAVECGCFGKVF